MEKYESQESFNNSKESGVLDSLSDPSISILNPISKAVQASLPIGLYTPETAGNAPTPVNRLPPPYARQRPARHAHRRMSTLSSSSGVQTRRTRGRGMYFFF